MPYFTYGDYVYGNDNDEIPKYFHKNFIKKQEPEITITSPMRLQVKNCKHCHKCMFKTCLFHVWKNMFKLLQNYQELMCGTNKFGKGTTCVMEERMLKIFWVMLAFKTL